MGSKNCPDAEKNTFVTQPHKTQKGPSSLGLDRNIVCSQTTNLNKSKDNSIRLNLINNQSLSKSRTSINIV